VHHHRHDHHVVDGGVGFVQIKSLLTRVRLLRGCRDDKRE
jgi:hypothetical protein